MVLGFVCLCVYGDLGWGVCMTVVCGVMVAAWVLWFGWLLFWFSCVSCLRAG